MIPDGFQYLLDDFWNFQKFHQIWTRAPCIYSFYYTKIIQIILENIWEHPYKYYFYTSGLQQNCQFWKTQAPKNDEDPSNKIFKIVNIGRISIKKHEWIFPNMVQLIVFSVN